MRTFEDQAAGLVEQGDQPQAQRGTSPAAGEGGPPPIAARNAALKAQCEDIGRALDHLERLGGLFKGVLTPVAELAREFDACNARLEETTARLVALEEAHRALAASHAAALAERDRLAERAAALEAAELDLGDCRNASEALRGLADSLSRESALRAAELERLGAELAERSQALAQSEAALRAATARCAALEARLAAGLGATRRFDDGAGAEDCADAEGAGGPRRAAT